MNKNYYDLLDALLLDNYLSQTYPEQPKEERGKNLRKLSPPFTGKEVGSAYQKLIDDRYMYMTNEKQYRISIEGYTFIQDGMYKQKLINEKNKIGYEKSASNFLIAGSAAAVVYTILEIVRFIIKDAPAMFPDPVSCSCYFY